MNVSGGYLFSYAVAIAATFIISVYFFYEYYVKKLRSSLAWALGFFFYGIAQSSHLTADMVGEIAMGKLGFAVGIMVLIFAMILFYYGTSLLFFDEKSFFREKASFLLFLVFTAYSLYLVMVLPMEGFLKAIATPISLVLMMPIFLVMGVLFYHVCRALARDDSRRQTVLLVSMGWFLVGISSLYLGLFLGYSGISDSANYIVHVVAWILILYGMTIGKATRK